MKVLLVTHGCRANQYDSEAVRAMVLAAGHEVVDQASEAETAVFNSCAVTTQAEADLRQQVRRAARANPALKTVVMGCAAALDRGPIADLPGVRAVVGGADLARIASAIGLEVPPAEVRTTVQRGTRALLRVQDGCDEHCTFCATTLARGPARSRRPELLVREAAMLADAHPEIVLTGIHIGHYGRDLGLSLSALVTRLVREVPGVRFRLSSVEATEVDDDLRALFGAADGGLAPHLHAPLQSGSDAVLRRMGRHWYSAASYAAAIERVVGAGPFGLGADVIAGFPGESDADHRMTITLLRALPFTYLHVFSYSPRPGTAAPKLRDQLPSGVAHERAAELRQVGAELEARHRERRDGALADVVVTGGGPARRGLTEDFLTVATADPPLPRGTRFAARLERRGDDLFAHPASL